MVPSPEHLLHLDDELVTSICRYLAASGNSRENARSPREIQANSFNVHVTGSYGNRCKRSTNRTARSTDERATSQPYREDGERERERETTRSDERMRTKNPNVSDRSDTGDGAVVVTREASEATLTTRPSSKNPCSTMIIMMMMMMIR